jgi:NADPH:quinone reductase-like Zn-dependent oxidoreductase
MKAIVQYQYGSPDVLQLATVEKPSPKENEVLIKVHAAALNAADWHLMRASPFLVRLMFGLFKPSFRILGGDVAGVVEAVGSNVTYFKPGDEVFGPTFSSGFGSFAEYVTVKEDSIAHKPVNVSFKEASAVSLAGITALQALRDKGRIRKGQKVLINGASGGVGTFLVQLAKYFGAEVTAVCSPSKMDMVRSLGADYAIDYTKEDFTKGAICYDIIIAANGYHPISAYKRVLKPEGVYVMVGGTGWQMFHAVVLGPLMSIGSKKTLCHVDAKMNQEDILFLRKLLETGAIKPVLDREYKLHEVPDAMRYLEEGHAKGKIIIAVA